MNIIRNLLFLFLLLIGIQQTSAHEGMWLPHLLRQLEGDMQAMGMKMTADDIYSVNAGSLKDAILHFGGGCTGSIISSQGLVLTNHHCGYGYIQSHSSVEHNYLRNGFWARTPEEELTNPGLFVTIIQRIEDVTDVALAGVTSDMSEADRQSVIDRNLEAYKSQVATQPDEGVMFRPIYYGNQYLMFVTLTFTDIRLVGTPPESIGKFGS
ncbi:MAG TPA: S46 family peptidase, partial [Saprospiraceae bacterium]|nr:S46 family peptidase [Saprospiraceae bacterium]